MDNQISDVQMERYVGDDNQTENRNDAQNINYSNQLPQLIEDFNQQEIGPTIPEQHPNGYFSNQSDY